MMKKRRLVLLSIVLFLLSSCTSKTPVNTNSSFSSSSTALTNENICDLLSYYHGYLNTDDYRSTIYDIKVYGDINDGVACYIDFLFTFPDSTNQAFTYSLDNFPHTNSIRQGIAVLDMNGDMNDDIVLDLGENGHQTSSACFIFSPSKYKFISVADFTTLASPRISLSSHGNLTIVSDDVPGHLYPAPDGSFERWSEYKVDGEQLEFLHYLHSDDIKRKNFIF